MKLADLIIPADPREQARLAALPGACVPRGGLDKLAALPAGRGRYLFGADGLYLEVRTAVVHACQKVSSLPAPMPWGRIAPFWTLIHGPIPERLLDDLRDLALATPRVEVAGLIHHDGSEYRLAPLQIIDSSGGHIRYRHGIDPLTVAVDFHSHGTLPAFFSSEDDADDLASPSLAFQALVLGECDRPAQMKQAVRRVLNGWAIGPAEPPRHLSQRSPS